jgi:mono/diheme cytochrome c family protein
LLQGLEGPITVKGKKYNNVMPSHKFLNDKQMAEVLTYIRQNFGNNSDEIKPVDVYSIRKNLPK